MKIAFLTTRFERPSYRFRVGQFLPFLERHGVACAPFIIPPAGLARVRLFLGLRGYDAVFLQKKMLGPFDRLILRRAARRSGDEGDNPAVAAYDPLAVTHGLMPGAPPRPLRAVS